MKPNFGIDESFTKKINEQLVVLLANNYSLYFNTLNAHWNIEDSRFIALHEMLETQYKALADAGDEIAERIRQMGYKAPGSMQAMVQKATLKNVEESSTADKMIAHLASCHETSVVFMREFSKLGEEAGDYGLVDMLGTLIRDHEKTAWILRSHL